MNSLKQLVIDSPLIFVVLGFITIDIITGIAKALKNHSLKSAVLRNGGYKKYLIIFLVISSYAIDKIFFDSDILYTATSTYYIVNECLSITENLASLGIPIPEKIKKVLASLKDEDNKGNKDKEKE